MWQYSSCSLQNCVFCSSKVFGYCTMYSYRGAHTADMWVNTAFSCRICHIMPSEICHSFFMLLQDPIFISTCMLTSGWLKSKSVSKGTSLKIWNWTPSTNPNGGRTLDSYRIEIYFPNKGPGRRRRAFQYDSRLVATLIDDCHTESNRWVKF